HGADPRRAPGRDRRGEAGDRPGRPRTAPGRGRKHPAGRRDHHRPTRGGAAPGSRPDRGHQFGPAGRLPPPRRHRPAPSPGRAGPRAHRRLRRRPGDPGAGRDPGGRRVPRHQRPARRARADHPGPGRGRGQDRHVRGRPPGGRARRLRQDRPRVPRRLRPARGRRRPGHRRRAHGAAGRRAPRAGDRGPAAMIVTLTMNPSVDRTATLPGPLPVGGVNRIASVDDAPGGKAVNVTRALAAGGVPTTAVFPAPTGDPFVAMCRDADIPVTVVPATTGVRVNLTVTDPDGTTTKLNEPGATPAPAALDALGDTLDELAGRARWMVLCGSLPRGVPDDFYADLVVRLRSTGARVAVDTSDAPLAALASHLPAAAPDLVKPNGEELG